MSGIAGYFGNREKGAVLQRMVRTIGHRGRAGEAWYETDLVNMGACLSDARDTLPVFNEDRSVAVVFSGKLYNRRAEREALEKKGLSFRTDTDAEIILRLYQAYGMTGINHLRGGFAFALHDVEKDLVFLARDHMGIEPLYYATTQSGAFVFGSEIKAILEHPGITVTPDMMGIDAYLSLGYSPTPDSLFRGIHKLPGGHRIIWNPGLHVMIEQYWEWEKQTAPDPSLKTDAHVQARFDLLVDNAAALSVEDTSRIPGVLLTGGAGSAALAHAMAQQTGGGTLHTFAASYGDDTTAQTRAQAIAQAIGAEHHQVTCYPADMEVLPELIWALDEPVVDPGIVPMHTLSKFARQTVPSVVSAKGANDLLGGRGAYKTLADAHRFPTFSYTLMKPLIRHAPLDWIDKFNEAPVPRGEKSRQRLVDFVDSMRRADLTEQYAALMSLFNRRDKQALYGTALDAVMDTYLDLLKAGKPWPTFMSTIFATEARQGLIDNMLTTFEKVTALRGVEGRLPFMDYPMVEFMMTVPDHLKYHKKRDRILLRDYMRRRMPGIADMGQGSTVFPLEKYMAARPLRDMIDTCLSEDAVKRRGLFKWSEIKRLLHLSRTGDVVPVRQIFGLLTLELWFRIYVDRERGWITS